MCGICGHTDDGQGEAIGRMNGLMIERGPDDEGSYVDREAGVSLGARRLSILDVDGGHQPLSNEDGTVWAVLNGEIYNYPALRERLLARGHSLSTRTDTELLVHLYEDFGPELVHALEGMFALAIWDSVRGRLLLARDRFGEKPLFYMERGEELVFASELTALTAGAALEPELDARAVDAYFILGYVPGPGCILKGVRQLQPASRLLWSRAGGPAVEAYWDLARSPADEAHTLDEEVLVELEQLMGDSVRSRMLADVPLGVFLSGGTDSMLVAAFAAQCSSGPIKTFTVDYDVGTVGEGEAAARVAQEIGSDHRELTLTRADVERRVPALLASLDQPLADQALVALHAVSEFARPEIKVALGGEGADELFGGYPRYRWLRRSQQVQELLPRSAGKAVSGLLELMPESRGAHRLATVASPETMLDRHLAWVTFGRRELRNTLYGRALRSELSNGHGIRDLDGAAAGRPNSVGDLMRLDLAYWLPDDVLAKADRASMRASLEMRTPYLSRQLAEFAATIPADVHAGRRGKRLLRALAERRMPSPGRQRPKQAFRVPADEWLRGPLNTVMRAQLAAGSLHREEWFDRRAVGQVYEEHVRGRNHSAVLWPLLALGLWLDRLRGLDGSG